MKKIVMMFLALGAAICQAESIPLHEMDSRLQDNMVYCSSYDSDVADLNDIGLYLPAGENSATCIGVDKGYRISWMDGLEKKEAMRGNGFTVSFDLHELKGDESGVLLSLYTPGYSWGNGLLLRIGRKKTLELLCRNFGNATNNGRKARIELGRIHELTATHKTITVVYDGEQNEVRAYVDGTPTKKSIHLKYNDKPAVRQLAAMQFGSLYGGGCDLRRGTIDNLCIWNEALSDKQVASLVKNGIPPMVWDILAGLGALLLFVAQAALFYAAGRRSALKRRAEA